MCHVKGLSARLHTSQDWGEVWFTCMSAPHQTSLAWAQLEISFFLSVLWNFFPSIIWVKFPHTNHKLVLVLHLKSSIIQKSFVLPIPAFFRSFHFFAALSDIFLSWGKKDERPIIYSLSHENVTTQDIKLTTCVIYEYFRKK